MERIFVIPPKALGSFAAAFHPRIAIDFARPRRTENGYATTVTLAYCVGDVERAARQAVRDGVHVLETRATRQTER